MKQNNVLTCLLLQFGSICFAASDIYYQRAGICCDGKLFCRHILFLFMEVFSINAKKSLQLNEEIRDPQVRLVDSDGSQLGLMSAKDAQKLAFSKDLDLVKIAPQATPPVCKIMDYSKYCFEQSKREKEARKNQKVVAIKEVQLSVRIETHDFNTKLNHALRFLKGGDKVKVALRFRYREILHPELGTELMQRFADACKDAGVIEKPAKLEGRNMIMVLAPRAAAKPVK